MIDVPITMECYQRTYFPKHTVLHQLSSDSVLHCRTLVEVSEVSSVSRHARRSVFHIRTTAASDPVVVRCLPDQKVRCYHNVYIQ